MGTIWVSLNIGGKLGNIMSPRVNFLIPNSWKIDIKDLVSQSITY